MSLNNQKTKYRALDDWFNTPQGLHVSDLFTARVSSLPELAQGSILLQLGSCGENSWLNGLNYKREWIASPCLDAQHAHFITSLNVLPLNRNSVDCVIAPFVLEAFGWHKSPLDELDRILRPMGHVIFLGINPFSLWGLALQLGFVSMFATQHVTLISPFFLQQSLLRRGYRQCSFDSFYYIPPVAREEWIKRLAFLNEMGKMFAVTPAGFYCLIMQKIRYCSPNLVQRAGARRTITLNPEPAWANRNRFKLPHPN